MNIIDSIVTILKIELLSDKKTMFLFLIQKNPIILHSKRVFPVRNVFGTNNVPAPTPLKLLFDQKKIRFGKFYNWNPNNQLQK